MLKSIVQSHKSHNAPIPCPTMHHSQQKCAHFCDKWCIVGYRTGALWDLWITSTVGQFSKSLLRQIGNALRSYCLVFPMITEFFFWFDKCLPNSKPLMIHVLEFSSDIFIYIRFIMMEFKEAKLLRTHMTSVQIKLKTWFCKCCFYWLCSYL